MLPNTDLFPSLQQLTLHYTTSQSSCDSGYSPSGSSFKTDSTLSSSFSWQGNDSALSGPPCNINSQNPPFCYNSDPTSYFPPLPSTSFLTDYKMDPSLSGDEVEANVNEPMDIHVPVQGDDSYDDGEYINHDGGLEDSMEMGQQTPEGPGGETTKPQQTRTVKDIGVVSAGQLGTNGDSSSLDKTGQNADDSSREDDAMDGLPIMPSTAGSSIQVPRPNHANGSLSPGLIGTALQNVKQDGWTNGPQSPIKSALQHQQQTQPATISGQAMAAASGQVRVDPSTEAGPSRLAPKKAAPPAKKRGRADLNPDEIVEQFLAPAEPEDGDMPMPGTIFKNAYGPDDVDDDDDDDDDEDSPNERRAKKAKNLEDKSSGFVVDGDGDQARRKIRIEYIEDRSRRHITFSKRKAGIMKKAYELSTLTGTQLLLLVVSETGLVYTFSTDKLSPMVQKSEGVKMIQACLNAPDAAAPVDEAKEEPKPKKKAKDKLAIRPLKLNDSAKANLAASTLKAAAANADGGPELSPPPSGVEDLPQMHQPSMPSAMVGRPKKRLPSGKSKKALTAAKKATENEEIANMPGMPDMHNMHQMQEHHQSHHPAARHDMAHGMHPNMPLLSPLQGNYPSHINSHMGPDYHHQSPSPVHPYFGGAPHPGQQMGMPTNGYYPSPPNFAMPGTMPPNAMGPNQHYGQHQPHPMQQPMHYDPSIPQEHNGFPHHHHHQDPQMNAHVGLAGH